MKNAINTLFNTRLICALFVLVALFNSFQSPAFCASPAGECKIEEVSMYTMNSATALKRINNGVFSVVYRGFGSRKADKIERDELLGFHFLIDTDCLSHGVRALLTKKQQEGMSAAEALIKAKIEHVKVLQGIYDRLETTKNLYENCKDKNKLAQAAGSGNPESHFVFTSPRIGVARLYGPIVMVIEETRPRGLDLNAIAKDAKYYTVGRILRNISDLYFGLILADYVADRDEYVFPSYVSPRDVTGMIVHSPSAVVIGGRLAVPPPAVRRVYHKYNRKGAMTIDVMDSKDRLIARLCASPSAAAVDDSEVRSSEKLPAGIQEAWNNFVNSRKRR